MTYKNKENFSNLPGYKNFKIMPKIATPQFTPNILHPQAPLNTKREIGVYEPAIRIYIEAWSKV